MMDEIFFGNALRRGLNDDTISNVTIKSRVPAVGKGENFLSHMWRFVLGYSCRSGISATEKSGDSIGSMDEKEIRLIVKCQLEPQDGSSEMIEGQDIFETEMKIYETILPKMEKLLGRSVGPKSLYQYKGTDTCCIILEDLKPLGFRTKDRQTGMSMAHVLMALESIADFHAASVHHYEQNPEIIRSFKEGIITEKTPKNMFRIIEQTFEMVNKRCRDWPDPEYKIISKKLEIIIEKYAREILQVTCFDDTEFCVLNHGDCWTNNIMFREDERGNPLQVLLIDYQMSVYSSPVIDLVYFLSICPAIDIKTDNDDMFMDKYLESLSKRMNLLGCRTKPPTTKELEQAILKRRMWAVMAAIGFYPRMIADVTEIESFYELLGSGITRMNIFKNPTATVALQKSLLFMERRGYLD